MASAGLLTLLAGCGPTPEQQAAMDAAQRFQDQNRCAGFGFAPGTENFAHCMMSVAQQRDAQQAADRRAAAARQAAEDRQKAAIRAAKDAADQDAWDRRTGQGKYATGGWASSGSSSSSPSTSSSNPADAVADKIYQDMDKINSGL